MENGRVIVLRLAAVTLACLTGLTACSTEPCGNTAIRSIRSPDGGHLATVFGRDCGATTGVSTQVSVDLGSGQGIGNVFVADAGDVGALGVWGGPRVAAAWTGPNELSITYDGGARVFVRNGTIGDVRVTYRAVTP